MGYVVSKGGRWYAVGYQGIDPMTGRDRRRWHRAVDEAAAQVVAESLPSAVSGAAHGITLARFSGHGGCRHGGIGCGRRRFIGTARSPTAT